MKQKWLFKGEKYTEQFFLIEDVCLMATFYFHKNKLITECKKRSVLLRGIIYKKGEKLVMKFCASSNCSTRTSELTRILGDKFF